MLHVTFATTSAFCFRLCNKFLFIFYLLPVSACTWVLSTQTAILAFKNVHQSRWCYKMHKFKDIFTGYYCSDVYIQRHKYFLHFFHVNNNIHFQSVFYPLNCYVWLRLPSCGSPSEQSCWLWLDAGGPIKRWKQQSVANFYHTVTYLHICSNVS